MNAKEYSYGKDIYHGPFGKDSEILYPNCETVLAMRQKARIPSPV